MKEIRNMTQSFIRKSGNNWIFYSFNPPISKNNWANSESQMARDDRLVFHSDYRAVPKEWLGEQFIIEAEYLKQTNEKAYEHEYLGLPVGTGGDVFRNVEIEEFTKEQHDLFDNVIYGVDFGFSVDPATWVKCYYHNNKLWIIDEIYEQGLSNKKLADRIKEKEPTLYRKFVTCDSSEPKSIQDLRDCGINAKGAKKGPDSRDFGYKWLQSLDKIYINSKKCPKAVKEFTSYEYERNKEGEFISKYPDGNDHIIDAVRYACESIINNRRLARKERGGRN